MSIGSGGWGGSALHRTENIIDQGLHGLKMSCFRRKGIVLGKINLKSKRLFQLLFRDHDEIRQGKRVEFAPAPNKAVLRDRSTCSPLGRWRLNSEMAAQITAKIRFTGMESFGGAFSIGSVIIYHSVKRLVTGALQCPRNARPTEIKATLS